MIGQPALMLDHPAFLDDPALRAVLAALPEARIVGGAVRDAIAGRSIADIDLATPHSPDEVAAALRRAGLKAVPTGLDHGTITAIADHRGFEVTTLRRDVETDGRHARVEFTQDWRADAARRDFTINALSMTPDGQVFDYFTGIPDLHAGRVRFVGDPALRIAEDYLRILRYFRFQARYGTGEPDRSVIAPIRAGVPGLAQLSGERVWSELKRILATPDPWPTITLMHDLGVLDAILPHASSSSVSAGDSHFPSRPMDLPDAILTLAALGPRDTSRLRLSAAEQDKLTALAAAPALPENATDTDLRRALADTKPDILTGRAWLAQRSPALGARIQTTPVPVFPLQGRDLQVIGIPPGPEMGVILRDLRAWWLEQGCEADVAAELARRRPR